MKSILIVTCLIFSLPLFAAKPLPPVSDLIAEAETVNWNKAVKTSIIINAPVKDVWNYASNSNHANDWSVFFDHISPLPGIEDGKIGALRRCFRLSDESGPYWDEVTTKVIPYEFRQITTYNLVGFKFASLVKGDYAFVRQLYRAIDENTTEMTFQTSSAPSNRVVTKVAFMLNRKETRRIFYENLENIKAAIEGYPRAHEWR